MIKLTGAASTGGLGRFHWVSLMLPLAMDWPPRNPLQKRDLAIELLIGSNTEPNERCFWPEEPILGGGFAACHNKRSFIETMNQWKSQMRQVGINDAPTSPQTPCKTGYETHIVHGIVLRWRFHKLFYGVVKVVKLASMPGPWYAYRSIEDMMLRIH